MEIDLCDNSKDTADGIHAASLGGIINCVLRGFAGLKIGKEALTFCPQMPAHWKKMQFFMEYKGQQMQVTVRGKEAVVKAV